MTHGFDLAGALGSRGIGMMPFNLAAGGPHRGAAGVTTIVDGPLHLPFVALELRRAWRCRLASR